MPRIDGAVSFINLLECFAMLGVAKAVRIFDQASWQDLLDRQLHRYSQQQSIAMADAFRAAPDSLRTTPGVRIRLKALQECKPKWDMMFKWLGCGAVFEPINQIGSDYLLACLKNTDDWLNLHARRLAFRALRRLASLLPAPWLLDPGLHPALCVRCSSGHDIQR